MEGKALLFKIYSGVDAFDIEVNEHDPETFIRTIKAISPTFGAINSRTSRRPNASRSSVDSRLSSLSPSCTTTSTALRSSQGLVY